MTSIDFLMRMWGNQCTGGDYVCLATRSEGGQWVEHAYPWGEALREDLQELLERQEGADLYFCPLPFTQPQRRKQYVKHSHYLWSDIDGADHTKLPPSVLWESSPGRFHGLWLLPDFIPASQAAEQSKRIAYFLGADKGGWDLTQLLRVPGTHNYKYSPAPEVKLIRFTDKKFNSFIFHLDKWRSTIPRKLLTILDSPAEQGKRSDMLWYLEHELLGLGIPIGDVVQILRESDWNKYKGRADEEERFTAEIEKIRNTPSEGNSPTLKQESRQLIIEDYCSILSKPATSPGWMVKDFWMRGSHGIVAGEPKSFKSTLILDMLFSVASNSQFLGSNVEYGGPVLIVQNENADWIMKDRLEKLTKSKNAGGTVTKSGKKLKIEWAKNQPIFFVNQQGFTLDDADNKMRLEELIQELRPVAINLDPLYLMFSGDVNSAKDLNPMLNWCLRIKQEYGCSVILVHHYNKSGEGKRGGQRMLGSTTLHGWIESAWYIQTQGEGKLKLDREFRGASLYEQLDLQMKIGQFGDPLYQAAIVEALGDECAEILTILEQSSDAMSKSAIARATGLTRYQVDKLVDEMQQSLRLERVGERYQLKN